jgi:hypothetical protein
MFGTRVSEEIMWLEESQTDKRKRLVEKWGYILAQKSRQNKENALMYIISNRCLYLRNIVETQKLGNI